MVKYAMQLDLLLVFLESVTINQVRQERKSQETEDVLTVKVQPELFLVSPNRQERKGAELHLVTTENFSTFIACWKDSKLFDYESLYQGKGTYLPVPSD